MTKEQAAKILRQGSKMAWDAEEFCEAYDMAIKALEQQPSDCKIFGHKENCFGGATENECNHCDYKIQAPEKPTSDDCVSRQAVVEYIKACDAELGHDCENEAVVEDILNMPPVTPTQKWIFVSEKLPEEGKEVLAYYEYFRYGDYNCIQTTYGVGYQYDGLWCGDIRGHKLNVIAWQPLPEAYKEK